MLVPLRFLRMGWSETSGFSVGASPVTVSPVYGAWVWCQARVVKVAGKMSTNRVSFDVAGVVASPGSTRWCGSVGHAQGFKHYPPVSAGFDYFSFSYLFSPLGTEAGSSDT